MDLASAISAFGKSAKARLSSPAATGEPEDQLRTPFDGLLRAMAEVVGVIGPVDAVGETSLSDLKTRPDYAVAVRNALVGYVELKAPGKGADPRRFKDKHDKLQWDKLKALPNLIYSDGNSFSLCRSGEVEMVVSLEGDIETAGVKLSAPDTLRSLFADFFAWQPIPPNSPRQLAEVTARLCRLLRDEAAEQLAAGSPALRDLAGDWRTLLFPEASDEQFADGYAQAVTFGLLMAKSRGIGLAGGLDKVAMALGQTTLIGAALRLLTEQAEGERVLVTGLDTLTRVLDAVDWARIAKGDPEAWLYFYEHFLEVYDNALRRKTGSYYTPVPVVQTMVRLVDEALRSKSRFKLRAGLADRSVTIADPAVGSGTYLLAVLRKIAEAIEAQQGAGAVPAALKDAAQRLIGFEIQFGPFAVAQLRLTAELFELAGPEAAAALRLYITNTLGDPYEAEQNIPGILKVLSRSRAEANQIKARREITVVIGNPPYKEKAKGRGGWVESGSAVSEAPLTHWMAPADWGVGAHLKHLRNLYVYFWRWATWKVFGPGEQSPNRNGVVCFITVAGFLSGPGFQKMRDDLRRACDDIWVIDCSPDGHQPEIRTRIFQDVQQPVCIVLASRSTKKKDEKTAAKVRFRALPKGDRNGKFAALLSFGLEDGGWLDCPSGWRAPFLPEARDHWGEYPALADLICDGGSGVMPGRTWVIAPDAGSLSQRWQRLISEQKEETKKALFQPHTRAGKPGDKHLTKRANLGLYGQLARPQPVSEDYDPVTPPIRYAFRSFDRQWIIPDVRLINQPNPGLWRAYSEQQVYLTSPEDRTPTEGPALSFSASMPDLHHYAGRGGRVFPLWADARATEPNTPPAALGLLSEFYGSPVTAPKLMAYIAAVAGHPAYTARFREDLTTPGLRIPLTASAPLFAEAAALGAEIIWLHTYGERFTDETEGRPHGPPRVMGDRGPQVPREGAIPLAPDRMPDMIDYDAATRRLHVGMGYVENVEPAVWEYTVSGKAVVKQWFSYRRKTRERPLIGDKRKNSPLADIQPEGWLAEYTEDLINLLHVLTRLTALDPRQAELLDRICAGPLIAAKLLRESAAETPAAEV